jgi:adenylate cyclase
LADTFVRFESDGQCFEVPIERLGVCGFGRSLSNTVVLTDTMASREHAMIRRNATGSCVLNDLGSTNGTRLNGRPVSAPTQLSSGDVIQIGRQSIVFVQTNAPEKIVDPNAGRTQFLVEQQLVSVLVVDLRNYTPLSAKLGEQTTAELMGEIFRQAGALLQEHGCWSTKFIGDAIMAVWIHPSNSLARADIVNAFDVISGYQEIFLMAQRQFKLAEPLKFGCGFNAGMASIGNIGSASSADFTAMGEAVNIAFRLESATKPNGWDVLIARQVFEALSDAEYMPDNIVEVELKGYDHPIPALPLRFDEIATVVNGLLADA